MCEHIFGLCHQIIKDFTHAWFLLYGAQAVCQTSGSGTLFRHTDGKACASGYNYTHTDNHGLDLVALYTYPWDDEINNAVKVAYKDAENLWSLLGCSLANSVPSESLPSIQSWFTQEVPEASTAAGQPGHSDPLVQFVAEDFDSDYDGEVDCSDSDSEDCKSVQIQQA